MMQLPGQAIRKPKIPALACFRANTREASIPGDIYASGSTAKPKGIVHTTGGYLTGVATTMAMVFDLNAEREVFWCTADVGWITGHSYIVYGPMANDATSVMFEGAPDYPDRDAWWNLIEKDRSRSSTARRPRSAAP